MKLKDHILITLDFIGIHYYKNASGKESYLSKPHRHKFHIKAGVAITHDDRQIEFIRFKENMLSYVRNTYENQVFEDSCEKIARDLVETLDLYFCEVWEDGENGACIYGDES